MDDGHNNRNARSREETNHCQNDAPERSEIDLDMLASSLINAFAARSDS